MEIIDTIEISNFVEFHAVSNGMWAIASTIMFVLLIRYIVTVRSFNLRQGHTKWWLDVGVKFASAMSIMVIGHMIRSWSQWLQLVFLQTGDTYSSLTYPLFFGAALCFIITGKFLILWTFTPIRYRKCVLAGAMTLTFGIPFLVFWFV